MGLESSTVLVLDFLPLRPLEVDEEDTDCEIVIVKVGAGVIVEVTVMVAAPPLSSPVLVGLSSGKVPFVVPFTSPNPKPAEMVGLPLSSEVLLGLSSMEVVADGAPDEDESSSPGPSLPLSGWAERLVIVVSSVETLSSVGVGALSSTEVVDEVLSSVAVGVALSSVGLGESSVKMPVAVGKIPVDKPIPVP